MQKQMNSNISKCVSIFDQTRHYSHLSALSPFLDSKKKTEIDRLEREKDGASSRRNGMEKCLDLALRTAGAAGSVAPTRHGFRLEREKENPIRKKVTKKELIKEKGKGLCRYNAMQIHTPYYSLPAAYHNPYLFFESILWNN